VAATKAGGTQPFAHQVKALMFFAEQLAFMHHAIIKEELALVIALMRHAFWAAPHRETGRIHIDEERADLGFFAFGRFFNTRCRHQDHKIGFVRMANKMLRAIDNIGVTFFLGLCFHRANIRPCTRLCHG